MGCVILLLIAEKSNRHLSIICIIHYYVRTQVRKAIQRGLPNTSYELQEQGLFLIGKGSNHIPERLLVRHILLLVFHFRVCSQVLQIKGLGLSAQQPLEGLLCMTPTIQHDRFEQREVSGGQHISHARLDPHGGLQDTIAKVELR